MKFSKETLDILNNFKLLNRGLVIKQGNVIKTRHQTSPMPIAKVTIPESFPRDFAIAELQGFLSTFSLLEEPEVDFTDTHAVMSDGTKTAKIRYAAPTMVVHMDYNIAVKLPTTDVSLELSEENLKAIEKAATSFMAPEIAFVGDGVKTKLTTYNSKNTGADTFEIALGESDKVFSMIVNVNHLQLMRRSYNVGISFKGLLEFTSITEANTLQYWIAASEKSKVG